MVFNIGLKEHHSEVNSVSGVKVLLVIFSSSSIDDTLSCFNDFNPVKESALSVAIGLLFKLRNSKLMERCSSSGTVTN